MTDLSVNVNKVALIRNSREGTFPSVTAYAEQCIAWGANGITAHPRPDQRHITAQDCIDLSQVLKVEFNIEGNPFAEALKSQRADIGDYPGFMQLVSELKPAQCTLVPDNNSQLTSDHGFNLKLDADRLSPIIEQLHHLGIRSSLFMDPDSEQIKLAAQLGVNRIELYTGPYAANFKTNPKQAIANYIAAANTALEQGLQINAGHDLNLDNLGYFIKQTPTIAEVSIGHAFTVDCLYKGLPDTVKAYQQALGK